MKRKPDRKRRPGGSKTSGEQRPEGEVHKVDRDWGLMEVEIAPDAMVATMRFLCPRDSGRPAAPEKVLEELKGLGIEHGVDVPALLEVTQLAARPGGWKGEHDVARGTAPTRTEAIAYPVLNRFDEKVSTGGPTWRVGDTTVAFLELYRLFRASKVEDLVGADLASLVVEPGEILAERTADDAGDLGSDIFGKPLAEADSVSLKPGENVSISSDGVQYTASAFGYLCCLDRSLSVIPPFWVSPDKMAVYYVNLPQIGESKLPTSEMLGSLLDDLGVTVGIQRDTIKRLCDALKTGKKVPATVLIARGLKPQPGEDARLEFGFDPAKKSGEVREDGSIDLRERNLVNKASEGEMIARKVGPTAGRPGQTVTGEPIETTDGKDIEVHAGDGVRLSEEGEGIELYAETGGAVVLKGDQVCVNPEVKVNGDVDYSTGNLDVEKDLYVSGAVTSGFTVKAGGNVTVAGAVESGATMRVKGDLTVGKGILGETTTVAVLGELRTRFVQNATVVVRGDAWIGSYIHNASVQCGGVLVVEQGGGARGGSVIGGKVSAGQGMELASAGSPSNPPTALKLQAGLDLAKRLEKVREGLSVCDETLTKMMRTLGLHTVDADSLKAVLSRAPASKQELYVKIVTKLDELVKYKRGALEEEELLRKRVDEDLRTAQVKVSKALHAKVTVQIGSAEYITRATMGPTVLKLRGDEVVLEGGMEKAGVSAA